MQWHSGLLSLCLLPLAACAQQETLINACDDAAQFRGGTAETTLVKDVVVAMTRARGGVAYVVAAGGRLAGLYTDGDFRRGIAGDGLELLNRPVGEVMTRNPVNVDPDDLAVDVLRIFEQRKIDDLPVVDAEGRLVGGIDIQDLPKLKVM